MDYSKDFQYQRPAFKQLLEIHKIVNPNSNTLKIFKHDKTNIDFIQYVVHQPVWFCAKPGGPP